MKVTNVKVWGWDMALDSARATMRKAPLEKEPSERFKREMLLCEHSPIRLVNYSWVWEDIPMWVTTHLVRHHIGCEKFVATQRTDRTGSTTPRNEHLQGELNSMMFTCNAQALINISKVRMCKKASPETREAWGLALVEIAKVDPIVVDYCVPQCLYRGLCPERESCGFRLTRDFALERYEYVRNTTKR